MRGVVDWLLELSAAVASGRASLAVKLATDGRPCPAPRLGLHLLGFLRHEVQPLVSVVAVAPSMPRIQNRYFSPNWILRGSPARLIVPVAARSMPPLGCPN